MTGLRRAGLAGPAVAVLLTLACRPALGHDPSAWGGLFRSRDQGATWVSANRGSYLGGATALAIDPTDANRLLLGTESGLYASSNGGRDWSVEAPALALGSVLALVFSADGRHALAATGAGLFRREAEGGWRAVPLPRGAAPARALLRGDDGGVYLAGWTGLFRSDDGGTSWSSAAGGLPRAPVASLLAIPGSPETLLAVLQGRIWASSDGGRSWEARGAGLPPAGMEALGGDPGRSGRLWAGGGGALFRSEDGGARWRRAGAPLSEPNTTMHAVAARGDVLLATTDRGLYRSTDGGENWALLGDDLPSHLEAGPLLWDPGDADTVYAGFSLIPYRDIWRRAAAQEGALAQVSGASLAGGGALLLGMALGGAAVLRSLAQYYRTPARDAPAGLVAKPRRSREEAPP
ncbi:WD40/YVTN/BNR-like repeat-containing protein [Paracraurococcus lichenis]|uniref:Exo-alpha-sialidase n=1 Tax=Paracraurococcus lichenis TaxID=3064888 RepID=A0ABT9E6T6_9PROT|nr:hypothetical protein [Paracraurococcus sp. LOR1-02]MDO9711883.1 hypothetical protein [Paracraurococcus sp. LOR1-02]